jgi:hypothetical protein
MGRWKAIRTGPEEPIALYDLFTDIGETRDVASANPDVVERVLAYLDTARVETRAYDPEVSTYRYVGQVGEGW